MRLKEVTQAGSFYTFETRKQICEELTKQRGWAEASKLVKSNKVCFSGPVALNSYSGDKDASIFLVLGGHLSHGRDALLSGGTKEGSECLSCTNCFSSTFNPQ